MTFPAVRKQKSIALSVALLLVAGLSCDRLTAPPTTGDIAVSMLDGSALALDGIRISVSGPTPKTITLTSGDFSSVAIAELTPGDYAVVVEGLVGGRVARYGQASAVAVTRGNKTSANVALSDFQPVVSTAALSDTVNALHFVVSYSAVPHATSYVVEWSKSPTMSNASRAVVTSTSHEIAVEEDGQYYFAVRAANAAVPVEGLPSPTHTVYAFVAVASVTVLPLSPTIADGQTQQFNATARDAANAVMSGVTFFWTSSDNAAATVNQSGLVTAVGPGQATITAIAKGTPGSATLTVTPQAASKLVFTAPPINTVAGASIAEVKVAIQNPKGQVASGDNTTQVTLAIAANPGSGTLAGTATATVVQGVATFNGLSINKSGTGYTLSATATSLASATSGAFNIVSGAAHHLTFAVQPTTTTAGEPFSPAIQVEIQDANNNRVISARDAVTIAILTNPGGGTLAGSAVVNAIDGIASFSGVSIDKAETGYALRASSGALPVAPSGAFDIDAAAPASMAFRTQPANANTDGVISMQVTTHDRFGNIIVNADPVTVTLGANPGGGTLTGTLTQPVVAGVADFSDLNINRTGSAYTLVVHSGNLPTSASDAFDISFGAPAKLAFVVQPADAEPKGVLNQVDVAVQDAAGNQTDAGVNVTLNLPSTYNPGVATLSGTLTVMSASGIASFTNVSLDSAAAGYRLAASAASMTSDTSAAFSMLLEFVNVYAGDINSCSLTVNGNAYCWGRNNVGGNGDGGGPDRLSPVRVSGGHTFSSLSTGYAHSCGIRASDSTAYCWGWNVAGQLGTGTSGAGTNQTSPAAVVGGHKFIAINAGSRHTCAIRADSLAFCWGQQEHGRLGNSNGAAGAVSTPTEVFGGSHFASISAGYEHSCGLLADGTAFCWGRQANGRLGNNTNVDVLGGVPVPTAVQGGLLFVEISAGGLHTCARNAPATDGRAYCWGANTNGQLGVGDLLEKLLPTAVANGLRFANIESSHHSTCGASVGGAGFCWGLTTSGRLGNGESVAANREFPQSVLGGLSFLAVQGGQPGDDRQGHHSCGLTTNGVYCWGGNNTGMLGDGSAILSSIPVRARGQR